MSKLYEITGLSDKQADYQKNYEIIVSSIKLCKKEGFGGLRLPSGTFAVYNDMALELFRLLLSSKIPATDYKYWQSHPNVLFDIDGTDGFVIDGDDTVLLLDGLIGVFDIKNSESIKISNVTIDWINPPFFTGIIKKIFDHKITVETYEALIGNEPIVSFQNIDCINGRQKGMSAFCDISNVCKETENLISFESKEINGLSVGDGIIARYIYGFAPVMHFYKSRNISIENTIIHAGCGMGIIAHKCANIFVKKFNVVPSADRWMSTNTDATHFISCTGQIHFDSCNFKGMGDDAVNVHGFYIAVKDVNDNTVTGEIEASVQDGIIDVPDIGDVMEFCDRRTLLPFASGALSKVEFEKSNGRIFLEFQNKLPNGVNSNCCLANTSKTAELLFENCSVNNIRGRALLIQTRNATVKNNVFLNCTGQGIHIDTAAGWWESIGTRDIKIINNKFINCGYGMTKYCDAVGIVVETEADCKAIGVHKDIIIKNNYIEGENIGIKAECVENLEMSNNQFIGCKSQYEISHCNKVQIY